MITNSQKYPVSISRLDYKNPTNNGGFKMLPSLNCLEEIADINEVKSITVGKFYTKEEMELLRARFPKSYKACQISGYDSFPNGNVNFDKHWFGLSNLIKNLNILALFN